MDLKNVESFCLLLRRLMNEKCPNGIIWPDIQVKLPPNFPQEDIDEALNIVFQKQWVQEGGRGALVPGMRFSEWTEETTNRTINIINSHIASPIQISNVSNSQISVSSPGSVQEMSHILDKAEIEATKRMCEEILLCLESVNLLKEMADEIRSDVDALQGQLSVTKPKRRIVGKCLHSIRSVIESAAGSVLVSGFSAQTPLGVLLEKIDHLRDLLGL